MKDTVLHLWKFLLHSDDKKGYVMYEDSTSSNQVANSLGIQVVWDNPSFSASERAEIEMYLSRILCEGLMKAFSGRVLEN